MLTELFPAHPGDDYRGQRAALWLLGLVIAIKLLMSLNSIFNTEAVAVGADGFQIDTFGPNGARAVLMLFALTALGQLMLALVALLALVRYRALVPLVYTLLLAEHLARRFIVQSHAVERAPTGGIGAMVFYGFLAILALGLALSLIRRR